MSDAGSQPQRGRLRLSLAPPPADAMLVDRWHSNAMVIDRDAARLTDAGRSDLARDLGEVASALRDIARRYAQGL